MSTAYWHYFISLEKDFIRTLDFVDLAPTNSDTYGDNFAKLLLATGSETDVICKAFCTVIEPTSNPRNILEYKTIITGAFPQIHDASISIDRTGTKVLPWRNWSPQGSNSPDWWTAYNTIKHDRVKNFHLATQQNALEALAGLLVINRYFHRKTGQDGGIQHPEPYPSLLNAGTPAFIVAESEYDALPGLA